MRRLAPEWSIDAGAGRLALGAAAGVAVFLTGARPTGSAVIDLLEIVVAVTLVVVVGSRAPWWLLLATAGVAGAIGLSWPAVALALLAFVFAAWVSPIDPAATVRSDIGAVSVALTVVAFSFSRLEWFTGASAIVAIGAGVALIAGGWMTLQPVVRRQLGIGLLAVAGVMVVASLAMLVAALGVRDTLRAGTADARKGARLTADLDAEPAAASMADAAAHFDTAHGRLGAWWTQPARLVPVVAQHRSAGVGLTGELADQLAAAAVDLVELDLDGLRVRSGAVDLAAIRALEEPVGSFASRFDSLEAAAEDASSVWLVGRVRTRLDELDDELLDLAPKVDDAVTAVDLLPDMLGGDGKRRYLMLFTTPSEARGLGGFIGNYAIVAVDDGRIVIEESGRRSALERAAVIAQVRLETPTGLMEVFGKFGLGGDERVPVNSRSWSNLTMEPDWQSFAPAALELYNDSLFEPVDGVIVADAYVVAQLTAYTGPVETLDGRMLQGDALLEYLLVGQYASRDRIDALEVLSERIITAFLDADLPRPIRLARGFESLIDEQRLLVWTDVPDEAELLDSIGIGSGLPELGENDAFSLGFNNGSGSKLDAFIHPTVVVEHVETSEGLVMRATAEIHNTAPTEGYSNYVIGNLMGLPTGTHRMILHAFTPTPMGSAVVNGERRELIVERHDDWYVGELWITLDPGDRFTIVYEVAAQHPGSEILVREQPMVRRD